MSRLLLAGVGPLPSEGRKQLFAPGLRLWIFATTLARAGHEVRLALRAFGDAAAPGIALYDVPSSVAPTLQHAGETPALRFAALEFRAEAIIATADIMADAAARANLPLPLWVDYYGCPMAERQQQAALHQHDGGLAAAWRMMLPALLSADRFSGCSNWQRLALIGQLSACGRLNRLTAGEEIVFSIPPGSAFAAFEKSGEGLRGTVVPEEAFVILWTGGFNTWTDVSTLYAGVRQAMEQDARIHFVSTGGAIPGQCEEVYPAFQRMVEVGPHRERFHLLGWIDLERVQSALLEGDLALNIDCFSYEGLLGTRTRMLDWMRAGLPFATTILCELSEILRERGLIYSFGIGDADDLARVIMQALHDPVERRGKGRRAREFLETEWTNERLLAPLLKWAEKPQFARDVEEVKRAVNVGQPSSAVLPDNTLAAAQRDLLEGSQSLDELEKLRAENAKLNGELSRLHGSRLVQAFLKWKGW